MIYRRKLTNIIYQRYTLTAILKKLINKGYRWDLSKEKLKNGQSVLPLDHSLFVYNGKYSGGKVLLIPPPLVSSILFMDLNFIIFNTHTSYPFVTCAIFNPKRTIFYEGAFMISLQNFNMV